MEMSDEKKLAFIHKMAHLALSHVQKFDSGGTVLTGPTTAGPAANTTSGGVGGFLGNILGTSNKFQATGAPVTAGTNTAQLNESYNGAQQGLNSANNLNSALTPGVAQGAGAQSNLSNQLANESMGGGPNPAQAALNQNTGVNVANQAALMASQRGVNANPGMLAAQAARQGAATQQQAAGQEATQAAQQQLNAQNALATLSAQQVGQGTAATQLQNQTQQNEQNILQGANTAANSANVAMQSNLNNVNGGVSQGNQNSSSGLIGGIGNALGAITGLFAEGGEVPEHISKMAMIYHPKYASGGPVWENSTPAQFLNQAAPAQNLPGVSSEAMWKPSDKKPEETSGNSDTGTNPTGVGGSYGLGGQGMVDSLANSQYGAGAAPLSMPEIGSGLGSAPSAPSLGASLGPMLASGGKVGSKLKYGGKVPGKSKVDHDDYDNDTVSAKLSPGEVVIDLDTLHDKGELGKMARYVAQNIARKKAGRKV